MMQDKTYSVRWYGPFESIEEIKVFEKKNPEIDCQLYLINGYKPRARYSSYYCGQTQRGVNKRLSDPGHHINDCNRIEAIWIGSITSIVDLSRKDINIVEKIITAQMTETYGSRFILNETNTLFPKYNVYVLNFWHKKDCNRFTRYKQYTMPADIPDVIGHEYERIIDAHSLFSAEKIKWYKID